MTNLGVDVDSSITPPSRALAMLASAIWLAVSVPFFYAAYLYSTWPPTGLANWRGWIFAAVAAGCAVTAILVPPRYRVAIAGTKVRWWARFR